MAYGLTKSPLLVAATPSFFYTGTSISALNITGDITIETWVKFTSMPADRANIIAKPNAAKSAYTTYHLELEKNGANYDLRMLVDVGTVLQIVDKLSWNPSTGVYYHIAATRNSSTGVQKIIIDGTEAASATNTSGAATGSTAALTIGNFAPDTTNLPLDGRVSLVRVWNTVRTPTQINDNKCVVYGTATTNMQGEWSLDDVLTDASGNGSTLTNVGSVVFAADVPSTCSVSTVNSNFFALM